MESLRNIGRLILLLISICMLTACGGDVAEEHVDPVDPAPPADTYFSLAVTENSHNHVGARLLFLDFQNAADTSMIQNNVIIAPQVNAGDIVLDGNDADWDAAKFSTINGLPQNNYPLSEFIDAVLTDITVGAAWDTSYIYFLVQWEDAGHNRSIQFKKWVYGNQGNGESGWNPMAHRGDTGGAPNSSAVNVAHTLAGSENEDRIMFMFPMTDSEGHFVENGLGCAAYCHANLKQDNPNQNYTGTTVAAMHTNVSIDKADIWHWKALRTDAEGYADDKHIVFATGSNNGRSSDSGTSAYINNILASGNPTSMHPGGLSNTNDVLNQAVAVLFSGLPTTGDEVPSILGRTPSGSRADVQASATYDDVTHRWTVELRRLRNTGNSDDRQFVAGTNAQAPIYPTVLSANPGIGSSLYSLNCESCHGPTGIGEVLVDIWNFPRIHRTSGSLILKALEAVSVMNVIQASLGSTPQQVEQAAEDIAAYLQAQATFVTTNSVTVTVNGTSRSSTVTSIPAGIDCPATCTTEQTIGSSITLTANDVIGYVFTGWGGDCAASGTNTTCTVTLSTDQVVTANYTTTPTNTLTVSVNGTSGVTGAVTSNPAGIDCPNDCIFDFDTDTAITLTANTLTGYVFINWGGACSGTNVTCDITLSSDLSVSADYTASVTNYTLTVTGSANGTVTDSNLPLGIDCGLDCTDVYADGSTVTLTATPAMGYQFDSWSGDVCNGSTSTTCQFTITADTTVAPGFSAIVAATCANKGVIYDVNGTNGYGRQMMINEGTVSNPTDLAFIPGSTTDFLVTAQGGTVHYFDGGCDPVNSIDISSTGSGGIGVVNGGERGLLNVEFHPDYSTNNYVFLYHTRTSTPINSVSRMTVSFDGAGNLQLTDPVNIIDFHKVGTAGNHNGGGLVFAPDNTLLASVGDGGSGSSANAQVNTNLLGTVVRLDPSLTAATGGYTIPAGGNMFNAANAQCTSTSANSAPCPEILAMGLRNPYRMSIDGDIVYLGDVGTSYEEINSFDYTDNTLNFGWDTYDGPANQSGFRDPILAYQRNDPTADQFRSEDPACSSDPGCTGQFASVIIGDVYRGSGYGGDLTGRLLHAEFMDGFMRGVRVNATGQTTDSGMHLIHHDGISAMLEGPDGYIYIATQRGAWGTGDADIVYRLVKP